ncbi:MAG: arsenate reductase ArsC [Gammaproteobacteria bacterium]
MTAPRRYDVLFLCTGNAARSIMAEAIMNHADGVRFRARSAGSQPQGEVHPLTVETLRGMGLSVNGLYSKSWHEVSAVQGAAFDFVFTLCDEVAGEECPRWPGRPVTAHWAIADPVSARGGIASRRRAFAQAALQLQRRIRLFLSLPLDAVDGMTLQQRLDAIGRTD